MRALRPPVQPPGRLAPPPPPPRPGNPDPLLPASRIAGHGSAQQARPMKSAEKSPILIRDFCGEPLGICIPRL